MTEEIQKRCGTCAHWMTERCPKEAVGVQPQCTNSPCKKWADLGKVIKTPYSDLSKIKPGDEIFIEYAAPVKPSRAFEVKEICPSGVLVGWSGEDVFFDWHLFKIEKVGE